MRFDCSAELRGALHHAAQLAKELRKLEIKQPSDKWLRGRSDEVRSFVGEQLRALRRDRLAGERAVERVTRHLRRMHREIALRPALAQHVRCCPQGNVWGYLASLSVLVDRNDAVIIVPAVAVDSPEVMARIHEQLPFVTKRAYVVWRKIGRRVPLEDMGSFARIGLVLAARTFDETKGPFGAWACNRMKGAMYDGARHWTRHPRGTTKMAGVNSGDECLDEQKNVDALKRYSDCSYGLEIATDPHALFKTIAAAMPTPEDEAIESERNATLRRAVARLPRNQREVIRGHYFRGQTLHEAAATLRHRRSWGSRLHERGITTLRRNLTKGTRPGRVAA